MVKKALKTQRRAGRLSVIRNPELVFGLVGPIGVNLDAVVDALSVELKEVGYTPVVIHI